MIFKSVSILEKNSSNNYSKIEYYLSFYNTVIFFIKYLKSSYYLN